MLDSVSSPVWGLGYGGTFGIKIKVKVSRRISFGGITRGARQATHRDRQPQPTLDGQGLHVIPLSVDDYHEVSSFLALIL